MADVEVEALFEEFVTRYHGGANPRARDYLARAGSRAEDLDAMLSAFVAAVSPPVPSESAIRAAALELGFGLDVLVTDAARGREIGAEASPPRRLDEAVGRTDDSIGARIARLGDRLVSTGAERSIETLRALGGAFEGQLVGLAGGVLGAGAARPARLPVAGLGENVFLEVTRDGEVVLRADSLSQDILDVGPIVAIIPGAAEADLHSLEWYGEGVGIARLPREAADDGRFEVTLARYGAEEGVWPNWLVRKFDHVILIGDAALEGWDAQA